MTEVTVATGRKQVLQPQEYFFRPLHQEIKGVILKWCEETYDSFGKSWTGTKAQGVCPFSQLSLPECMCVQRGEEERLDLEIMHLV